MAINQTVICDIGTGYFKLGWAGDNFPKATFPTIVGRPILRQSSNNSLRKDGDLKLEKDIVVGEICDQNEGALDTSFPVRNGIINDPENMKHIWDYSFNEILKLPRNSQNSIILTEAANNPLTNRALLLKTMFEDYGFARAKIVPQAVLSLYAQGLKTGLVVDSGDGVSHIMPVFNSFLLTSSVRRVDIAGSHITQRLIDLLQMGGYYLNSSADKVVARKIKEKCCFVAGSLAEMRKLEEETCALRTEYKLENGEKVILEKERYLAPECLFNPGSIGIHSKNVPELVYDSVYCDSTSLTIRKELMGHIVLSGGTTMLKGFPTRLEKDVGKILIEKIFRGEKERLKAFKLRVEDPPRRKIMVFHGASILGKMVENDMDFWKTKEDWEEKGDRLAEEL